MRLLIAALAVALAVAGLCVAPYAIHTSPGTVVKAAEYCLDMDPIYYQGQMIYPGGEYCVPGP
jgi:hypothetical protein